jgi:putative ABC transport system ATP-binding protein
MDPTHGTVEIGDVDVRQLRFSSLRRKVVMVPQEGMLLSGTIADNVRMGLPVTDDAATEVDVDAAIGSAFASLGLDDWLNELPDGLATEVGERGGNLSAGERQLVALARAYVADPAVLVLDEATSAVDPATEVRLQRALYGLAQGRTTVTIAHRLSTAERADRILVFDGGKLVADGPHATLASGAGVYRALYRSWTNATGSDGT